MFLPGSLGVFAPLRVPSSFDNRLKRCAYRLKAAARMSGTLRVARVPYEEGDAKHDEAVALFDQYSGSYPISGEFTVRDGRLRLLR